MMPGACPHSTSIWRTTWTGSPPSAVEALPLFLVGMRWQRQHRRCLHLLQQNIRPYRCYERHRLQLVQQEVRKSLQISRDDAQQVIGFPTDRPAFQNLRTLPNCLAKGLGRGDTMAFQRDVDERHYAQPDLLPVEQRSVALDHSSFLHPLHPALTLGCGQVDPFPQVDITEPAVLLQRQQQTAVKSIQI